MHIAWKLAVMKASQDGDTLILASLLQDPKWDVNEEVRRYLAWWLRRIRIAGTSAAKKPGRRPVLFGMTAERRLEIAANFARKVRNLHRPPKNVSLRTYLEWGRKHPDKIMPRDGDPVGRRLTREEAIEWAVWLYPEYNLTPRKLANYMDGKRGASRRQGGLLK